MIYRKKNWGGLNDDDQIRFNKLFSLYVPNRGPSNTNGGEMLRCISRLVYKFYNDGERVSRYYSGIQNILKGANTFLLNMSDKYGFEYHDLEGILAYEKYSEILDGNLQKLFNFVTKNKQVFIDKNTIDTCEVGCPEEWDYDDDDYSEEEDY